MIEQYEIFEDEEIGGDPSTDIVVIGKISPKSPRPQNPQKDRFCKNCGKIIEFVRKKGGGFRKTFCSKECAHDFSLKKFNEETMKKIVEENRSAYELDEEKNLYREIKYGYLPDGSIDVVWTGDWMDDGDDDYDEEE